MNIGLTQLIGRAGTFTADGQEWRTSALTMADFAELQSWFMSRPIDKVTAELEQHGDQYTEDEKRALIDDARKKRHRIFRVLNGIASKEATEQVNAEAMLCFTTTPDGVGRMLWHALRKNHSDITPERCRELCSLVDLGVVKEAIDAANFPTDEPSAPEAESTESGEPPTA